MNPNLPTFTCRDCATIIIGYPLCVTCGAQKLYDHTLATANSRAEKAETENEHLRRHLNEQCVLNDAQANQLRSISSELAVAEERIDCLTGHNAHIQLELAAAQKESNTAWSNFRKLRAAYSRLRYPTLEEDIKLTMADFDAATKEQKK